MNLDATRPAIAFVGPELIAAGELADVARAVREMLDADPAAIVVVLDTVSSETIELDLRGAPDEVVARLTHPPAPAPRPPGRPKLGVVGREVTLLPRQWEWLASQPGGASVTLRRLVDAARRDGDADARIRAARESAYRFMTVVAGDLPGYEEAVRALFAGDPAALEATASNWPAGVRDHVRLLAEASR